VAVTVWRLRRWCLWFLALMTATQTKQENGQDKKEVKSYLEKQGANVVKVIDR